MRLNLAGTLKQSGLGAPAAQASAGSPSLSSRSMIRPLWASIRLKSPIELVGASSAYFQLLPV